MSHLLIATDFSESGTNAVHYGCQLAAALGYDVKLIHAYMVPIAFNDTPLPMVSIQDAQSVATDQLNALMQDLRDKYPNAAINEELMYGDIEDCINECVENNRPELVVIGSGSEDGADVWLSGYAADLLRDISCTVLAIPAKTVFALPKNICLACDLKELKEEIPIASIISLLKVSGAKLHALHVDKEGTSTNIKFEDTALPQALNGVDADFHYTTTSGNIDEAIAQFAATEKMDWLAVIPHHYSFLERLFHKSHTSAMLHFSHLPLLALHVNN